MKKLFTLIAAMLCTVASMATDYTDSLQIYINDATTPVTTPATITVDKNSDGTLHFTLKNFVLTLGGNDMNVGNVSLDSVNTFDGNNGRTLFFKAATTAIENGDDPTKMWVGPYMGEVTVVIYGYLLPDNRLYTQMKIQVPDNGMDITCSFGGGFDVKNGGFETYHTASVSFFGNSASSDEPDYWHSFMSASGSPALVYLAGYNPHTFISNEVRPGSTGNHSLMLTSVDMGFTVANGTVTTGRINAGSATATDVANHAWLDLSSTDKDAHGDPFYQYLNGRPDSLVAWVRFIQGTPNADHPYATISTSITDGTYYQEPQDTTYTNVIAVAANRKIETSGNQWQRIAIPFEYLNNDKLGKAFFATISTNADAGQGSSDTIYIDDMQLVYDNYVKSVTYNGQTIEATPDEDNEVDVTFNVNGVFDPSKVTLDVAPHAQVIFAGLGTDSDDDDTTGNPVGTYLVFSDDLKSFYDVEVTFAGGTTTGISKPAVARKQSAAIYTVSGQRVTTMQPGQVYIVKGQDGTTRKVLK
jgi:hypothetical protein